LQRLDRARKIVWVVAPPGAGTTLVADQMVVCHRMTDAAESVIY